LADARSGEWWLSRVGIGLLLLGVVFFFAYSIERGWIGPAVRVGIGAALGLALVAAGSRVRRRPFLSGALLGGGVAILYASVFAAYGLYALVPHAAAFLAMVAITVLSFALSLGRDDVTPALVGTLGGLGTPFLLYNGEGSPSGLVLYTCLILAGAAAVYLYKGWVPLISVAFVGGWTVFGTSIAVGPWTTSGTPSGDRWALQVGVTVAWLLLTAAPVARVLMLGRNAAPRFLVPAFAVLAPLLALGFTYLVWALPARAVGTVAIFAAALYALAALALHYGRAVGDERRPPSRVVGRALVRTHALTALLLLNVAGVLILRGDALLLALAAEAAVLSFASRRLSDDLLSASGHVLSGVSAILVWERLSNALLSGSAPDPSVAADLAALALLFAASFALPTSKLRGAYRVGASLGLAVWLWRVLGPVSGDVLLLTLAIQVAVVALTARSLADRWLSAFGHGLSAVVAALVLARLGSGLILGSPPLPSAIADLATLALLLAVTFALPGPAARTAYRVGLHLGLLIWLWRVLEPAFGDAAVTASWGLYAAGLLVAGLLLGGRRLLVRLGTATLLLVVCKLFVVDLTAVGLGTRVLLFLGLGVLFLALGYYLGAFRNGTRSSAPAGDESVETPEPGNRKERVP